MNLKKYYSVCFFILTGIYLTFSALYAQSPGKIDYAQFEKNSKIEFTIQNGHNGIIDSVDTSPDGNLIVTASGPLIKIWKNDGTLIKTLAGHNEKVNKALVTPDGKEIISCSDDGTIKIWSISGALIKTLGHGSCVEALAMSSDGNLIVSGSVDYSIEDYSIKLWNRGGELLNTLTGHTNIITSVAVNPMNNMIYSGSWDNTLKIWNKQGKLLKTIKDNPGWVKSITVTADGRLFAYRTSNQIRILTDTGELLKTISIGSKFFTGDIFFSRDGKKIFSSIQDDGIYSWDTDGKIVHSLKLGSDYNIYSFASSPDGKTIIGGGYRRILLWNPDTGESRNISQNSEGITAVVPGPDGKTIYAGSWDGNISIWREDNNLIKIFKGGGSLITGLAVSADGRTIAAGGWDCMVRTWMPDGTLIANIGKQDSLVGDMAISPDGKLIASVTSEELRIWNSAGALIKSVTGPKGDMIKRVLITMDGKNIIYSSVDELFILDSSGNLKKKIRNDIGFSALTLSPDGQLIYAGIIDIQAYDLKGNPVKKITFPDYDAFGAIVDIAISPDNKMILEACQPTSVVLYDFDGKLIREFIGHSDRVYKAVFMQDNKHIISGSMDGTIRVWNIADGDSVSLAAFESGDWFVYNDRGLFDCSDGARKYIKFVKGLTVYEPDQFWNEYFTPGLFSKFMKGEKLEALNIDSFADNAPVVNITSPSSDTISDSESYTIKVQATPSKNGLGKIFLYINGRTVDENTRGLLVNQKGEVKEFAVSLSEGENVITGAAFDKDGKAEGRSSKVTVIYKPGQVQKPDMYILSIGVSDYKDVNISLKSPAYDAKSVCEALKNKAQTLYGNVYTVILTNKEANIKNIMKSFQDIISWSKPYDAVVLFFAGHGITDKGVYYFLPFEADITSLESSSLTIMDIENFIKNLPASKVALFFDTCQSGSASRIIGMSAMSRGLEERKLIADLAKARGIGVLSASSDTQAAYELQVLGNGILAYSIIQALNNKKDDITRGSLLSLTKLFSTVNELTRNTAYKYLKIEQNPVMYMFGDDFAIGK